MSVAPDVDPDTIELGWSNEDDIITNDSRVTVIEQSNDLINISSNFSIRVFVTIVQFDPVVEDDEGNYSCYSIVNDTETSTSIQLQTRSKFKFLSHTCSYIIVANTTAYRCGQKLLSFDPLH